MIRFMRHGPWGDAYSVFIGRLQIMWAPMSSKMKWFMWGWQMGDGRLYRAGPLNLMTNCPWRDGFESSRYRKGETLDEFLERTKFLN